MTRQCRSMYYNKRTPQAWDIDNGEGWGEGMLKNMETLYLPFNFALNLKLFYKTVYGK